MYCCHSLVALSIETKDHVSVFFHNSFDAAAFLPSVHVEIFTDGSGLDEKAVQKHASRDPYELSAAGKVSMGRRPLPPIRKSFPTSPKI